MIKETYLCGKRDLFMRLCWALMAQERQESSATFAGMAMVVEAFESAGCVVVLDKRLPPLEQALLGGGGGDILLYRIQLQ